MYQSRKSHFVAQLFSWYVSCILKKDFATHHYNKIEVRPDEAILILANHFSWWDGFLIFQINRLIFKKRFNVLVGYGDYNEHWYLKYLGAFAAEDNKKDVLETLVYAGSLLDDPDNLVLIFPQGRTYTSHVSSIHFEKGVMQIINSSKKKLQIIFAVNLTDYFGRRKPTVNTYLSNWDAEEYMSLQLLKSEYNKHYDHALKNQNKVVV
ncbi:MAG TPA: 1-acyl-sn-glycerol-3-phosphate acyltransferase [Pedobacter sp.]|nr:1-acyl-sn-glycerol-3-phosphate acyltransferase [Pedobacter sp.]